MKLEEEIKQSSWASKEQKLMVNLIYTYNWLTSKMKEVFKPMGVTMQQFNILRILRGQYPTPSTLNLLRERMLDKQSDVSRLLDRLEGKGLISRKTCESDRRKMDVLITKEGLDLLDRADQVIPNLDTMFSQLSETEIDTVNECLDKIRD